MAFLIALTSSVESDGVVLHDIRKVRLAGREGPLARHILDLPTGKGEWSLDGQALAQSLQADIPSSEGSPALFWDNGQVPFLPLRVVSLCGVSGEFETDLVVQLEILSASGTAFVSTARQTSEALRLSGGRLTPNAAWKWAPPKMSIGSAVVGTGRKTELAG